MKAGQVLVTHGASTGRRQAEVVEVLGVNAGPPFLVLWWDTGRTSVLYPDSDVWTQARPHSRLPLQRGNRCG